MKYKDSFLICFGHEGEAEIYLSGVPVGKMSLNGDPFVPHDPNLGVNNDPVNLEDILMGVGGSNGVVDTILDYLNKKAAERNKKKSLDSE